MFSKSNKREFYARIIKTLKKYNLTLDQYIADPALLFINDSKFRQHVYKTFKPHQEIYWYNKKYTFSEHIPKNVYDSIKRENIEWYNQLINNSAELDDNEDDLFEEILSDAEGEPASKKSKTEDTAKSKEKEESKTNSEAKTAPKDTEKSGTHSEVSTNNVSTKSEATAGVKRTNTETVGSAAKKVAVGGTTNEATPINQQQVTNPQSSTLGKGEVDQDQAQQQIQTDTGNAPNQRGTVQGEAGSLKVQKTLLKYGISKVNHTLLNKMNNSNKVFIFIVEDKALANDLLELMEETYDNAITYVVNTANEDKKYLDVFKTHKYIIGWRLNFNVGYPRLLEQLGTRYSHLITFTKNLADDEEIEKNILTSVLVRFKNNTQLLTLSELVDQAQENYKKYNNNSNANRKKARFD